MDMNDILAKLSSGTLSEDERNILLATLGGTKVRKASTGPKVPTEGLKIACQKFPVTYEGPDADGKIMTYTVADAYRELWYVTSPRELIGGSKHYVATRKSSPNMVKQTSVGADGVETVKMVDTNKTPWPPQFIQIMGYIGQRTLDDGSQLYTYAYDRLKSDGTKRTA